MEYDYKTLEEKFKTLPTDIQDAISSTEVHDSIVAIGNKYGLHVDQLGEMVDLVGLIMLGLSPSKDFIKNFSQEAGVKSDIATSIAGDINKEVFDKIRASMQSIEAKSVSTEKGLPDEVETKTQQSISDLERVGGFSIEPSLAANDSGAAPTNLPGAEEVIESRENLVASIENTRPMQTPTRPPMATPEYPHTDIIVDNLLAGPVAAVEKKVEKPAESTVQIPPPIPPKPAGPDAYREAIE